MQDKMTLGPCIVGQNGCFLEGGIIYLLHLYLSPQWRLKVADSDPSSILSLPETCEVD